MAGAKKESKKKVKNPTSMEEIAANIQTQREFVTCGADENRHTAEHQYSGAYASMGIDNSFSMQSFRENFKMEITHMDAERVVFEMQGISPAIANAFRRILIAEVPTMAIEKVYMVNNTSVIQDEVFAHRLGLIPIRADPRLFEYKAEGETYNERNTIVFKMNVRCYREKTDDGSKGPLMNSYVYTNELVWLPKGSELPPDEESKFTAFTQSQAEYLKERNDEAAAAAAAAGEEVTPLYGDNDPNAIATVHDDILLCKMVAGQEIELEAHCVKGQGKEHAKWSPVGTTWYRMVPKVEFIDKDYLDGEDADVFMKECNDFDPSHNCYGWFEKDGGKKGEKCVKVLNERGCDYCLERVRTLCGEPGWDEKVRVLKSKSHFIFTVETAGQLPPDVLFKEAVKVLASKCQSVLSTL